MSFPPLSMFFLKPNSSKFNYEKKKINFCDIIKIAAGLKSQYYKISTRDVINSPEINLDFF